METKLVLNVIIIHNIVFVMYFTVLLFKCLKSSQQDLYKLFRFFVKGKLTKTHDKRFIFARNITVQLMHLKIFTIVSQPDKLHKCENITLSKSIEVDSDVEVHKP